MRTLVTISILLCAVLALTGCAQHTAPVGPPAQLTTEQRNFESTWQGALEVLRTYYFTIDRQDRRAGVITTLPMTGRHWFEFWRHDAATGFDLAEGTVQTIYRQAKVTIRPVASNATTYTAKVEIDVYRSDKPNLQVTSTSDAYDLFLMPTGDDRRYRKMLLDYGRDDQGGLVARNQSVPLGRDDELEKKLEAEIEFAAYSRLVGGGR